MLHQCETVSGCGTVKNKYLALFNRWVLLTVYCTSKLLRYHTCLGVLTVGSEGHRGAHKQGDDTSDGLIKVVWLD